MNLMYNRENNLVSSKINFVYELYKSWLAIWRTTEDLASQETRMYQENLKVS